MKEIDFSLNANQYNSVAELSQDEQHLMQQAVEARNRAYAPYSKFNVGAAILLENGTIVTGNNQENAAYPSGMCAERVAIWSAGAQYPNMVVKKVVITAASSEIEVKNPVGPCGACRQALYEYEFNQKTPIEVIFMGETGKIIKVSSLASLLPFSFDSSFL